LADEGERVEKEQREAGDALRRTRLANERTYLAWWRTGVATFAVSLGVGELIPRVTSSESWPYALLGAMFAGLGTWAMVYSFLRYRRVERALAENAYAPPDERHILAFSVAGGVLGLVTLAILLAPIR
jgi:putative membrane protein